MTASFPVGLYAVTLIAHSAGAHPLAVAFLMGMSMGATKIGEDYTFWTWRWHR